MSKKALNRDIAREIRKTRSRFLSIFVLSALAVAFLAGLRTTAPDMEATADTYLDGQGMMDVQIMATLGLTEEDVAAVQSRDGVETAEGSYTVDGIIPAGDNDLVVKVLSISEAGLNQPYLLRGRMPENAGECLVEEAVLEAMGADLGAEISINTGTGSYEDALVRDTFTVVGTCQSPLYLSMTRGTSTLGTGAVSAFVLVPMDAFSMDAFTEIYLTLEGAETLDAYSDAYQDLVDDWLDASEGFADQRAQLRSDEIREEAETELNDAQQEYDEAEAEVQAELSDAEAELRDARAELDDGWAEYRDGQAELEQELSDAQAELDEGQQELSDALQELNDGEAEYNDGVADYNDGLAAYQDGLREFLEGQADYEDALAQWQDGWDAYEEGVAEIENGWDQYYDGLAEYNAGRRQLAAGRQQLESQEQTFQAGLTAFRSQLPSLGLPSYDSNAALLAAMADSTQAAVIDNALEGARTKLDTAISAIETQQKNIDTADAAIVQQTAEITRLEQVIKDLEAQIAAAEDEETKAALQKQLDTAKTDLTTAQNLLQQATSDKLTAQGIIAAIEAQAGGDLATLQAQRAQLEGVSTSVFFSGHAAINSAWQEIYAGEAKLQSAAAELAAGRRELEDGEAELEDARAELDDGRAELEDAKAQLDEAEAEVEDGRLELLDAAQQLEDARAELDDGWQAYYDGLQDLEDSRAELAQQEADARAELADAYNELMDGEADYAEGYQEYLDGKAEAEAELSDARSQLRDARRTVSELEDGEWYLLSRQANAGFVSYQQDAERMGNLAAVFPLLFFLVAALVCLTTMTRMVEEQRSQIGCLAALGYSKADIARKYVGYGLLASLTGSLTGLAAGCTLIPTVIITAWRILYNIPGLVFSPQPVTYLAAVAAAVACNTLAVLAAAMNALRSTPAALMRPRSPKAGKRVFLERIRPLWRRLSFTQKVTVRNLFRYKKRFWMTVIGIAGCTALIVTGFGLRDSILDIMTIQYDELYSYNAQAALVSHCGSDELEEVLDHLDGEALVSRYLPCYQTSVEMDGADRTVEGYMIVVESGEDLDGFITLRTRQGHEAVELSSEGVVLTEKAAELMDVGIGDTITLTSGDDRAEAAITAIAENYIYHYAYLTDSCYETLFGKTAEDNTILMAYAEDTPEVSDQVSSGLIGLDGISSVSRIESTRETLTSSMESVDYAVVLIIVCAAALAFVVLFNLTNINITERMRELATLKVLGFTDREMGAYVYRENVVLTIFGVLLGLVLGTFLHHWLVLTVEIEMAMFGRSAKPMSYLYAVGLTVLFSLLVNLLANRKLRAIDMVESLKSVE